MKTVTVEIDEQGNYTLDLHGFTGKQCDKVSKDFTGNDKIVTTSHKPSYFQTEKEKQKQ